MVESRSKGWVVTINNYTPEEWANYKQLGGHPHVLFVCGGLECGAEGTAHIQGYLEFKNRKKMSTVKRMLSLERSHLEPRRGTPQEAKDYCCKDAEGDDYYEHGTLPIAMARGQRTDLDEVFQAARDGATTRQLWQRYPNQMVRYSTNPVFRFLLTQ